GALLALIHYNYKPEAPQPVAARPTHDDEDEF
ncbi:MAG TPA: PTS sugar transporter subunit IIC, partial [Enterobacter sp.]|nr:PTS sugar transporter subunit IIC [Enterobacter sp.]